MSQSMDIQEGMQVYGGDQLLGRVERMHGEGFHVNGLHYTRDMVTRVEHNRIYLGDSGLGAAASMTGASSGMATAEPSGMSTTGATAGVRDTGTVETVGAAREDDLAGEALRVPIVEERLAVGTREVDRGEVAIRKTIIEEQQTVPVTLTHEEVRVEERDVADRPATGDKLFQEETIHVALRGEEAVVAKEAFVTGEVVIEKDAVSQERQITDTVRKQRVDVDQTSQVATGTAAVSAMNPATDTSAGMATATPAMGRATGYGSQLRESMLVLGADEGRIGVVKEVRANDFLVNRRLARDIYVPFTAIQSVTNERVMVAVNAGDVNDQGWPNP